ncbi:FtsX-like permease family protein [Puia sp. P3]|uniref:FtsX-like permease family protein n=1 Tax=Puia sp. P3 TaxID=3423952 RepID=UPI003D6752C8
MSTISHSFLKTTYRNDTWHFDPRIPGVNVIIKLAPHANPRRDEARINAILQRNIGGDAFLRLLNYSLVLQPLSEIHFDARYDFDGIRKAHKPALYGLVGAAVFILLLAVVNFINLSTAQALQKARDLSIRRILGASRLRLVNRSLTETAMLTSLAGIIALTLVRPVLRLFHDYIPEDLPFNPFSPGILGRTLAIITGTTLLAGLYPAVNSTGARPSQKITIRRVLVVFQFTISLLFIMASLTVGKQLGYMLDADMGFNSSAILTIDNFSAQPQQLGSFAQQALHIPGVEQYTLQNNPPAGMHGMEFPMKADNQTGSMEVSLQTADQRFIPLYHMRLLAGRNISAGDSLREFLINDTYRRALGFSRPEDAVGHFLTWQNKTRPIAGVVADFHNSSLHAPIPAMALANISDFDHSVGLRITLGNTHTLPQRRLYGRRIFPTAPSATVSSTKALQIFTKATGRCRGW